ncbi:hypothetical protein AAFF_G00086310 [Aldrovandia affinis]|uniref:Uncharacterized protein n=1 Tax=Aldrovandia affinis TaxID=143900 RepID=A0AAD7RWG9_9TELE|nr:hypothetical protein AAFF_G00086310 [Aldrovandia affinis]
MRRSRPPRCSSGPRGRAGQRGGDHCKPKERLHLSRLTEWLCSAGFSPLDILITHHLTHTLWQRSHANESPKEPWPQRAGGGHQPHSCHCGVQRGAKLPAVPSKRSAHRPPAN